MEKVLLEIGSPPDFQFSVARTSQSPFPMYAITFDIDTNCLNEHYHGNNVPNAYGDIRKFMEANEFDWM